MATASAVFIEHHEKPASSEENSWQKRLGNRGNGRTPRICHAAPNQVLSDVQFRLHSYLCLCWSQGMIPPTLFPMPDISGTLWFCNSVQQRKGKTLIDVVSVHGRPLQPAGHECDFQ
jgi:hypothetical protein